MSSDIDLVLLSLPALPLEQDIYLKYLAHATIKLLRSDSSIPALVDPSAIHAVCNRHKPSVKLFRRRGLFLRVFLGFLLVVFMLALVSCSKKPTVPPDHPRLTAGVKMVDVTFHSNALNRQMPYRVILPASMATGEKFPVLYLLHGGGGFRDWSNYSDVAGYAEQGVILVMPEGNESYYVNSADHPEDRYEDYIVHDLIADVENRFPVARDQASRAIAGVSMGGFGAITLALKHPDLFQFVGGLSSALDVPTRPLSAKRIGQWRHHRSIFGPWKG